jgi:ubiquinone/menaquinone biosynthesis C-methylase UbiE
MNPDNDYWDNLMVDDKTAANYMHSYGEGPGCETRMIISSFINDGESVLDVGCGPAWNFDHFEEYGPAIDYIGVDLSPRFVKVANERLKVKYGVTPISLGDCRDVGFPNDFFDVVLLQDILEHTNSYKKPLEEALRLARKRVIVCFWRTMDGVITKVNDDTDKGTNGYGADINKDEWETWLDSIGHTWLYTETSTRANRPHTYYIIDKEEPR